MATKPDNQKHINKEMNKYYVIKRSGKQEDISFDKITRRLKSLCWSLNTDYVDPTHIAKKTIDGLYPGITTEELDFYSANICADLIPTHPDFNKLAARIMVSNLHKTTDEDFFTVVTRLYNNKDIHDKQSPLVSKKLFELTKEHRDKIQSNIDYNRDYCFDYFGIMTLMRSYLKRTRSGTQVEEKIKLFLDLQKKQQESKTKLDQNHASTSDWSGEITRLKNKGIIVERPQHLWMRVALGIHGKDLESAFNTYHLMSKMYFTHATPTLFNSGSPFPQLSSCFLLTVDDSMEHIADTWKRCVLISKRAGGLGLDMGRIRARGSIIRTTNGQSKGIVPLAQQYQGAALYADQGGKRKGSIALYISPWHADIYEFLDLRTKKGNEQMKARDIFQGLWLSDLFMKRAAEKGKWSLMCPDECPGLTECYGKEFTELYTKYELEKKYRRQVDAEDLFRKILAVQIETGNPYIAFKDTANKCSNQKNCGIIRSSNLCMEIFEVTNNDEIAVCNLASICLPRFVENDMEGNKVINFKKMHEIAKTVTKNLNRVIDINYYPVVETRNSNMKHRPIGVGVQGLADLFLKMDLAFDSPEASKLNKMVSETIYHGCLEASCELAKEEGPYETFKGSPFSKGQFQFNMYEEDEKTFQMDWDWKTLRENVMKYGTRNSLLTAYMPTASTAQIMGNNESIEPYTSNLYTRKTLAGEYTVINTHLINDLVELNMWDNDMRDTIIYYNGSVSNIESIPKHIRDKYKTAYELKQKVIVDHAVDRQRFIDQSQSMNLFMEVPNFSKLMSAYRYGHSKGLKTGIYYLRGKPRKSALKNGIRPELLRKLKGKSGITNTSEVVTTEEAMITKESKPSVFKSKFTQKELDYLSDSDLLSDDESDSEEPTGPPADVHYCESCT